MDNGHLTSDEVMTLLNFMKGCDPIIVGGQSVNLWVQHYSQRDPSLLLLGSFTSKDLDIYANREATRRLADNLIGGKIKLPSIDDASPNAAVVIGNLGARHIIVDFMSDVLGVDSKDIENNYVAIEGKAHGREDLITLLVMHPLDCVRSRLTNINVLHRTDDHSVTQALGSIRVLKHFIDELIGIGELRLALKVIQDIEYVSHKHHIGRTSHTKYGHLLDLLGVMESYADNPILDPRWRSKTLAGILERDRARIKTASRHAPPQT